MTSEVTHYTNCREPERPRAARGAGQATARGLGRAIEISIIVTSNHAIELRGRCGGIGRERGGVVAGGRGNTHISLLAVHLVTDGYARGAERRVLRAAAAEWRRTRGGGEGGGVRGPREGRGSSGRVGSDGEWEPTLRVRGRWEKAGEGRRGPHSLIQRVPPQQQCVSHD